MSDTKVKIEQKNRILFGIMTASQIQPLHFPVQIAALLTYRYIQRKKWTPNAEAKHPNSLLQALP
ncbi:MAG: hypothetical protein H8E49_06090 [Gammaproteobacteria bacterium]|nr:hypothetical protein [Gammaproteobacteria bacterium]